MAISITDIISQNTIGNSDGAPVGVPSLELVRRNKQACGRLQCAAVRFHRSQRLGASLSGSRLSCVYESEREGRSCECKDLCSPENYGRMGTST